MSTEENKKISWRLQEEVFGQGKLELVDELLAPDYVSHAPGDPELSRGPEDIKEIVRSYHSAFPDINFAVEQQVAEGDMVVTRWIARGTHRREFMGVPPSGRRIEVSGMSMDRISGGRIVENWNNWEAPGDDAPDRCHPGFRAYPRRIEPAMQGPQNPFPKRNVQPPATLDNH